MVVIHFPDLTLATALGVVFLEWVRRAMWMKKFRTKNPPILPSSDPAIREKISVIVPARDEEQNIGNCLSHLIKQDHPDYEIIVVDDRSNDRTGHLVENFKKLSPVPLKLVRIEKLPEGWTGKNHAMMAGSKAASGVRLLFTDADTTHETHSLRSSLATAVAKNADFLTLAPQVECRSFWENVVQPLAVSSLALWFKTAELNEPGSKTVLANGQFILVKKIAYEAIGGNESVKNEVVEDVELAKKIKAAGYSVLFLNGTLLYSTRMYTSLGQIFKGWTRIFIHLFEKKILPIIHKIFLFLFFSIFPFVVLGVEKIFLFTGSPSFSPILFWLSSAVCAVIITSRFVGNKLLRTNPWYALLHPVASVVMTWLLLICVGRILFKGRSEWRGDLH